MRVKRTTGPQVPGARGLDHPYAAAFTLAEAMVAVAMGAVMLTALYAGITFGFSTVKIEREDLRATQIMVEQMETLRLTPYANLQNFSTNVYFDPSGSTNGSGGALYTISITTATPAKSDLAPPGMPAVVYYNTSMLRITATASWTNNNIARTRSLVTYAARNGVQAYVYTPR